MTQSRYIKKLFSKEELLAVYDLQMQVYELLDNKEWFEPLDKSFFETFNPVSKTVFGYYVNLVLAGISVIYMPQCDAESLSIEVDFDDGAFLHVAHLEVIAINPVFRNQGIAKKLSQAIVQDAKERKKRYLMATVHPKNASSIHVLTSLGMHIVKNIRRYGNKERYVMALTIED